MVLMWEGRVTGFNKAFAVSLCDRMMTQYKCDQIKTDRFCLHNGDQTQT